MAQPTSSFPIAGSAQEQAVPITLQGTLSVNETGGTILTLGGPAGGAAQAVPATATTTTTQQSATSSSPQIPEGSAPEHINSLATNIAGAVMSAPLAVIEALSPTAAHKVSSASTVVSQHASNLAAVAQDQAHKIASSDLTHQYVNSAAHLATQAKDAVLGSAHSAVSTAGQTASNVATKASDLAVQGKDVAVDTTRQTLNQAGDLAARSKDAVVDTTRHSANQATDAAVRSKDAVVDTTSHYANQAGNAAVEAKDSAVDSTRHYANQAGNTATEVKDAAANSVPTSTQDVNSLKDRATSSLPHSIEGQGTPPTGSSLPSSYYSHPSQGEYTGGTATILSQGHYSGGTATILTPAVSQTHLTGTQTGATSESGLHSQIYEPLETYDAAKSTGDGRSQTANLSGGAI